MRTEKLLIAAALAVIVTAPPPPLYSRGAAYDSTRHALVVFGGSDRGNPNGDSWEFANEQWARLGARGPSPRNGPVMTFDSRRRRIVLFGGDTRGAAFGDTWEFDGATWAHVSDTGPPPRSLHAMAYDDRRGRVVLYGGLGSVRGEPVPLDDTWEWDGQTWTRTAAAGPGPRFLSAMAFDASLKRTVLIGGSAAMPPSANDPRGETWEWDGEHWTRFDEAGPPPRDHTAMAFDSNHGRLVLAAGAAGPSGPLGDVWARTGRAWSRIATSGLPNVAGHSLAYDSHADRLLLFGGFSGPAPTSDLWQLNGTVWSKVAGR